MEYPKATSIPGFNQPGRHSALALPSSPLQIRFMVDTVANRYTIQITGVNAFQAPDIESIHSGVRARLVVGVDAAF